LLHIGTKSGVLLFLFGVNSVALANDGHSLVSGSQTGVVEIWRALDTKEKAVRRTHTGIVYDVCLSADGNVASAGKGETVLIWDAETGQQLTRLHHGNWIRTVAHHPHEPFLITGGDDDHMKIWDPKEGKEVGNRDLEAWVRDVTFSPDGHWLMTGVGDAQRGGSVTLWDIKPGLPEMEVKLSLTETEGIVQAVAFSPDSHLGAFADTKGNVNLIDIETLELSSSFSVSEPVWTLTFSSDGQRLIAGSGERRSNQGTIWIQNLANGGALRQYTAEDSIWDLALTADDHHLVTGGWRGIVQVWELRNDTLTEVARLQRDHAIEALEFADEGRKLVVAYGENAELVNWWSDVREVLCERLTNNLSTEQWDEYIGGDYAFTCAGLPVPEE
jgi:WD40 repeat protein